MVIQLPSKEEIEQITRQSLLEEFPFYHPDHFVNVWLSNQEENRLCVGYDIRRGNNLNRINRTHLDLNVVGDIFYLIGIGLDPMQRGQGNGWKLYQAAFKVADRMGFPFVRQTPSGGYHKDGKMIEPRREYLLRKGCVVAPGIQVDWIIK